MTTYFFGPTNDDQTAPAAGDQLYGGDGNDTLRAIAGGDELYGGLGDDALIGAAGNDVLDGGGTPDRVEHNILRGFGGDDTLISSSQGDEVFGGAGNDQVQVTALRTGQVADGGTGTDTLMLLALSGFSENIFIQMGATFRPKVGIADGPTYVNFENLYVIGGTGSNTILGGAGDDTIINSLGNVASFQGGTLRGGAGKDTITFHGIAAVGSGAMVLNGGTGAADKLTWTNGLAQIGALSIDVTAGTMTADGTVFARFGGFESYDFKTFPGLVGTIDVQGSDAPVVLTLEAASSTLTLGSGNDVITLSSGAGLLHAGAGDDTAFVGFLNTATQSLFGEGGNDHLSGGSGQVTLYGGAGNDTVAASNGHSHIYGGAGDDLLSLTDSYGKVGTGRAEIIGGVGRDQLMLELSTNSTAYRADFAKADLVLAGVTHINGVEAVNFSSGSGNDSLSASNDALGYLVNKLNGNGGDDTLRAGDAGASLIGGIGNDLLFGGAGNDLLSGLHDNDTLRGGVGDDTLLGGFGRDVMSGGDGADVFRFILASETGKDAATRDVIADFSTASGDVIDLAQIDANGTFADGRTAFTFIKGAAFHHVAGELRFFKIDLAGTAHDVTVISADTNGDGSADFQIELKGLITLTLGDFLLV